MAFWKQKHNQTDGFSLVEVVVAITILGIVVVPMFSSLLWSVQLNQRSDDRMQAQLAVSHAVETIMAEGYDEEHESKYTTRFPSVEITAAQNGAAYKLTVTAKEINGVDVSDIYVDTYVRPCK